MENDEYQTFSPISRRFHQSFTPGCYSSSSLAEHPHSPAPLNRPSRRWEMKMLVLSRKPGESIHIDEDIVITVLEVRPNRIRLGIDAPPAVRVQREEAMLTASQQIAALALYIE